MFTLLTTIKPCPRSGTAVSTVSGKWIDYSLKCRRTRMTLSSMTATLTSLKAELHPAVKVFLLILSPLSTTTGSQRLQNIKITVVAKITLL